MHESHMAGRAAWPELTPETTAEAWSWVDVAFAALTELVVEAGHTELEERLAALRSPDPVTDPDALNQRFIVLREVFDEVHFAASGPHQSLLRQLRGPGRLARQVQDASQVLEYYSRALNRDFHPENLVKFTSHHARELAEWAATVTRDVRLAQWLSLIAEGLDPVEAQAVTDAVLA